MPFSHPNDDVCHACKINQPKEGIFLMSDIKRLLLDAAVKFDAQKVCDEFFNKDGGIKTTTENAAAALTQLRDSLERSRIGARKELPCRADSLDLALTELINQEFRAEKAEDMLRWWAQTCTCDAAKRLGKEPMSAPFEKFAVEIVSSAEISVYLEPRLSRANKEQIKARGDFIEQAIREKLERECKGAA